MGIKLKYDPIGGPFMAAYAGGIGRRDQRREKYALTQQISANRTNAYMARGLRNSASEPPAGHWEEPKDIWDSDRHRRAAKKGWDRKRRLGKVDGPSPFDPVFVPDPIPDPDAEAKDKADADAADLDTKRWGEYAKDRSRRKKTVPAWVTDPDTLKRLKSNSDAIEWIANHPDADLSDKGTRERLEELLEERRREFEAFPPNPAIAEKKAEREEADALEVEEAEEAERERTRESTEKRRKELGDLAREIQKRTGNEDMSFSDALDDAKKEMDELDRRFPPPTAAVDDTAATPAEVTDAPGEFPKSDWGGDYSGGEAAVAPAEAPAESIAPGTVHGAILDTLREKYPGANSPEDITDPEDRKTFEWAMEQLAGG